MSSEGLLNGANDVTQNSASTGRRAIAAPARALSSEEIYRRILAAVMEHRLPPGTQLVEERLAGVFKVSRTKVREAIGRLVHDRIATNVPNRGAFVSSPTAKEAKDVFFARRLIEVPLVRTVAQSATARQVQQLRRHLDRERAARASDDPLAIVPLSGEFHLLLAEISGNSFLVRTLQELESLTALIILLYDAPDEHHCPYDDHPLLVDAIEAHDPDRAAVLMQRHLEHVEHSLRLEPPPDGEVDIEKLFA